MCGIAGIFHLGTAKPVDPDRVARMCDTMLHRGPDGSGVWTAQGVGLGHRRLSIIDLGGGAQPMLTPDGEIAVTFNGEIYNFQDVRAELEAAGHQFLTDSDTEVILHGYRTWGIGVLDRLHGMFAFALYDARDRSLLLARDRLGVKPLHYVELSDGSIAFASELKGLLAHPLLRRTPDLHAIEDYLAWGYVPDTTSIVAGVKKLPAGHFLSLRHESALPQPRRWWDLSFADRETGDAEELGEELLRLMRQAVQSRMVADVPLGAFLSGGVDSSSVVAFLAEQSREPVRTCSIGFDQASLDETGYARRIAERFGTRHRERMVGSDDFGLIDTLAAHFDEPFADGSALPTYRVCQLAREDVTVALSGDGADEALAGYRRHVFHAGEERLRAMLPAGLRAPLFGGLGRIWPKLDWAPRPLRFQSTLRSLGVDGDHAYCDAVGVTGAALRDRIASPERRAVLAGYRPEDAMAALMHSAPARSGLDRAQYADMMQWLPGDILTKTDRTSMAVSLEAREPLLDHRLIEFAARLPERMRVRGGQGKWLMKHAMEPLLPHDILYRPKMGFVTPIAQWLRGPLADQARAIGSRSALSATGWFDDAAIATLAEDHIAGRSDHSRLLWQLIMLDKSVGRLFD